MSQADRIESHCPGCNRPWPEQDCLCDDCWNGGAVMIGPGHVWWSGGSFPRIRRWAPDADGYFVVTAGLPS